VLAQTLDLVCGLANRFEEVAVLCASAGQHELPANVRVRVYGGGSRLGRGLRFERALLAELRRDERPAAVLAHMVPTFLILAAPLAKLARVRLLLWYTHGLASRSLKLAVRLAEVVLSADERSFPLQTPKLHAIGHAIDVDRFSPATDDRKPGPLRLLALGRFSPVKGYDVILEGVRRAVERGADVRLELLGPQLTEVEREHRAHLGRIVAGTPLLQDRVRLAESISRDRIPELLRSADALISATVARDSETFDKVVCEAGACAVPVLAANTVLAELLGELPLRLVFRMGDANDLADALRDFAAAPIHVRRATGRQLRERVIARHSVDFWADAVFATVGAHIAK